MIKVEIGKIHYVNAVKNGQKVGVNLRGKVIHFETTLDEHFTVDDQVIITMHRAPVMQMPGVMSEPA